MALLVQQAWTPSTSHGHWPRRHMLRLVYMENVRLTWGGSGLHTSFSGATKYGMLAVPPSLSQCCCSCCRWNQDHGPERLQPSQGWGEQPVHAILPHPGSSSATHCGSPSISSLTACLSQPHSEPHTAQELSTTFATFKKIKIYSKILK